MNSTSRLSGTLLRCGQVAVLLVLPCIQAQTAVTPRVQARPVETVAEFSFAGRSAIAEGTRAQGRIETFQTRVSAIRTVAIDQESSWAIGGAWQHFSFGPDAGAPLPERLTALAGKLGYHRTLDARWSLRAEIDPGLYGDFADIGAGTFNAPVGARLVYAKSREVQWVFGVNVDLRSAHPIVGGAGVRWQITPDWNLLLLVPAPRIEYTVARDVTLFAGAQLRSGTFRVASDFGRRLGRPELDDQNVGYRELSAGAGVRWQLSPGLALNASAGWMLDRRFEFDERNLLFNGDGAQLFQLSLTGSF